MKKLQLLFWTFIPAISLANVQTDVQQMQIRIGHPTVILGPAPNIVDNFFNSMRLEDGSYLCSTANATSYLMKGKDSLCTDSALTPILGPVNNGYADCGLWINDIIQDVHNSNHFYAFVHEETGCNYQVDQTHKSMGVAQSFDGGKSWSLFGQTITGTDSPAGGKITGEGDCTTIADDKYYYTYCYRNTDYKTIVARASKGCPPISGMWFKYLNGTWNSPGLGGEATPLNVYGSPSRWAEKDYIMMVSIPSGNSGMKAAFSSDRVNFFNLPDPLLISDNASWVRTPDSSQLEAYASVISSEGNRTWHNGFFKLTYMYLAPGAGFSQRYLISRDVSLSLDAVPDNEGNLPQVGVELSRWENGSGSTPAKIQTTNAPVLNGLTYQGKLGYLMTRQLSGKNSPATIGIEECVSDWQGAGASDYIITPNGTCAAAGYKRLRTLGWLYKTRQANTTALYRCWSPARYKSHFVSTHSDCDGEIMEYILGYILIS
ncbi:hypothetical protein [Legionella fairfieldensis]|uniref:hypothetical protein n=1 Tax=Legionella fairfieldensis TaxID=45064 RepID=UPI000490EBBB|nr:hypothetical protein [Legionella fairfieldensis]